MGMIAFLNKYLLKDSLPEVEVDPGGGYNKTCPVFSDSGDDSQPLPGDFVASVDTQKTGLSAAVGFSDPVNERKAAAG